jgi:hypothetical protein
MLIRLQFARRGSWTAIIQNKTVSGAVCRSRHPIGIPRQTQRRDSNKCFVFGARLGVLTLKPFVVPQTGFESALQDESQWNVMSHAPYVFPSFLSLPTSAITVV